ncbi:MAG: hypothetical protein P8Z71_02610 [Candidatus Sulfobium sp.]
MSDRTIATKTNAFIRPAAALKREDAIDEIRKKTGTQFDAAVVEAFMEVVA